MIDNLDQINQVDQENQVIRVNHQTKRNQDQDLSQNNRNNLTNKKPLKKQVNKKTVAQGNQRNEIHPIDLNLCDS